MKRRILIYADEGTSEIGVSSLLTACKTKLGLEAKRVSSEDIKNGILKTTDIFVIPGGADIPYCKKLNGEGNRKIIEYVDAGGLYIGICAGAYYACRRINFKGEEYTIKGERELGFFQGTAKGSLASLTNGNYFNEKSNSKKMVSLKFKGKSEIYKNEVYYYHGGPTFIPDKEGKIDNKYSERNYQIIARFRNGMPAIIAGTKGKGKYFLSSIHFELQKNIYEELVVKKTGKADYPIEKEICKYMKSNYGDRIWEEIRKII
ncbi:biotin--protein ligase [Leptotrichia sp. OH3620_COT-345]|uniref:BPL-N domain-containing protein n=1 Tax=Leptotrichia sp. OH3620_COT-345 TaxID=2491048 RepID=UPI000F64BE8B|nr:BPL-N domain-containing protein [Leptotrichia sp. OH3620_COT-345]RRD40042.1 biotin--protein ligase [Leptotrichia sp. OH3620_COT-345]